MHHPTYRITHTTAFVTPVVEHWLERETHMWKPPGYGGPWATTQLAQSYILTVKQCIVVL